jgi:galactoside O-acetyltransferase
VAVGAMSLVTKDLEPWKIYWGVPCKLGKDRRREILTLEKTFLKSFEK